MAIKVQVNMFHKLIDYIEIRLHTICVGFIVKNQPIMINGPTNAPQLDMVNL